MERLARVLFAVDARETDAARLPAHHDRQLAALAQGPVVLRHLVVLGHVRIEVVLAREHALGADPAVERRAESQRVLDRHHVRARQRARKPQAHGADVAVGLGAEDVRAAAEHLAARPQLHVALEADHRLPGHVNSRS